MVMPPRTCVYMKEIKNLQGINGPCFALVGLLIELAEQRRMLKVETHSSERLFCLTFVYILILMIASRFNLRPRCSPVNWILEWYVHAS